MPSVEYFVPYEPQGVVDYFGKTIAMSSRGYYVTYQSNDSIIYQYSKDVNWGIFILLLCLPPWIITTAIAFIYLMMAKKSGSANVYVTKAAHGSRVRIDFQGAGVWSVAQIALQGLRATESAPVQTAAIVTETKTLPANDTNIIEAEVSSAGFCDTCGVQLLEDDNFCMSCGTNVAAPAIEEEKN